MIYQIGDLLLEEATNTVYEVVLVGENIIGIKSDAVNGYIIIDRDSPKGFRLLEPDDINIDDFMPQQHTADVTTLHQDEIKLEIFKTMLELTSDLELDVVKRTKEAVEASKIVLNGIFRDNL